MTATSLTFNKRVVMPPIANDDYESKIHYTRNQLEKIVQKYVKKRDSNSENSEITEGIISLKERIENKEIICYPTDKSGCLSADTYENYIENMQDHLKDMIEVTEEEYRKTENLLNCHMQSWCRILNATERTTHNFLTSNNDIPPLYGLRKDHKLITDDFKGPPSRPVCGAVISCNYRISYFLSQILKPLIKDAPECCDSTEDLLHRINTINETEDLSDCVLGSMDVEALYPSIDIDFAVEKCVELLKESNISFNNVNTDELGLYITLLTTVEERQEEGITDLCPTRIRRGKNPTITGCGNYTNEKLRWSFHNKAKIVTQEPNIIRNMIFYAIGITLKVTLKNHICTFNNKMFKQMKGGAIGVGIAGDVSNLFMVWWDRKMKSICLQNSIELKLYSRYVDDTNLVVKAIIEESESTNRKNDAERIKIDREERTMKTLQEIGNRIHPSIKVTVDFPSNHENGRMPILDTEQWIENIQVGDVIKPQILHSHYSKPMASKYVTLKNSAIPYQNKINILINDLVRIMRNISTQCKTVERSKKIQEYLLRLQHSGYNKEERYKILIKARKKYEIMKENATNGTCPMYRSKFWNKNERKKQKQEKIRTWYNNSNRKYDSVFFVDYTEGSELANECQKTINRIGLKIKVVEKTGKNLKQELVRSNPFGKKKCRGECEICSHHEGINCRTREVMYEIKCEGEHHLEREQKYGGETSRSIGERFNEHFNDIKMNKSDTPIYKHFVDEHNGNKQPLSLKIIKRCQSDAMLRQATEAVYIRENNPLINRKSEFGNTNIAKKNEIKLKNNRT